MNNLSSNRLHQSILIAGTILISWLGMQGVHECGHVIGAMLTGAEVRRVVLDPLSISRTDVGMNPNPLFVVWAGPIFGILIPLIFWIASRRLHCSGGFVARFFAGFCLIANGAYIGIGSFDEVGDCREMLLHGSPKWILWLFGCIAVPCGLGIWHGLGHHFGLGRSSPEVNVAVARGTFALSILLLIVLLFFGHA